jgi:NADPH:quinone reductase-like Zn-dependent oxidoreductase
LATATNIVCSRHGRLVDRTIDRAVSPLAALAARGHAVWGASAVGRVIATGESVPEAYAGKRVAIYRSLRPTPETIGPGASARKFII